MIHQATYQKLVEHMAEAVWMGDHDEKTIYANPKFCELLGYSLEEIIGKESYGFRDHESAEMVRKTNNLKRKKGESSSYEGNLITKSGKIIPVLANGAPLPGGGTIGIMTDLRELKKQESIYKKLIEHMDEAVWMGDSDEKTVYANPKFCKLLGYNLEEIIGKESYSFWDSESVETVRKTNSLKRKKGESSSYEGNLITKSGKIIPVMTNGTPLPDGGTIGIMTDLREIKEKEENEKILFNAVQYSTDAIIICNTDGKISSWNKGANIIFGYRESIIGKELSTLFQKKDLETILQSNEIINKYELRAKSKNKQFLDISITQTPIFNNKKTKVISYLLICRDITNHRKVEQEIESKYKKIREVYQSIGIIKRQSDYIFDLLDISETYHYDLKSMGDFIVTSIIMLTRVDACILRIYDTEHQKLKMVSSFGFQEGWEGKSSIKFHGSLAEKAFLAGSPLKIMDLHKEPLYQSIALARKNDITSLLLIPLSSKGKCIGSISLYAKADKKLEIFENEFIEKYAKIIQVVLANSL